MKNIDNNQLIILLKEIVTDLVSHNFNKIVTDKKNGRLTANEIKKAVYGYPGDLTMPPEQAFDKYQKYITDQDEVFIIEFELWYDNEPSDLTLLLEFKRNLSGNLSTEIDDIRVL